MDFGTLRELITTTRRTTRVAFWDPFSGFKNWLVKKMKIVAVPAVEIKHYDYAPQRAGHASLPGPTAPLVTKAFAAAMEQFTATSQRR